MRSERRAGRQAPPRGKINLGYRQAETQDPLRVVRSARMRRADVRNRGGVAAGQTCPQSMDRQKRRSVGADDIWLHLFLAAFAVCGVCVCVCAFGDDRNDPCTVGWPGHLCCSTVGGAGSAGGMVG